MSTATNRIRQWWEYCTHLHRMNDHDDLNLYYGKFLDKLSKISLKIFLPFLPLIYLIALFLCRLLLLNSSILIFDYRSAILLGMTLLSFISLILIRLHTKWRTLWFFTRFSIIFLLVVPLIVTFQTVQFHILLSTIAITLTYSFLTFTLLQSLIISLSISIFHIIFTFNNDNPYCQKFSWLSSEFISLIVYHAIINIAGLYAYVRTIKHVRDHFHAYEVNLYEKNKFSVDCKKLNTIIAHCQQPQFSMARLSKLTNGYNTSCPPNIHHCRGTVINCNLSLNEQTRLHTCDELATLFDVLFCQIEQLVLKQQPNVRLIFDNETIIIVLSDENEENENNIDICSRLAIEVLRFIQHVNNITQWNLTSIIGIDYDEFNLISNQFINGSAYEYARWLREECGIANRIHVSSRIYDALKLNKFYEFHSYAWITNNNRTITNENLTNPSTYFLFSTNMYEPLTSLSTSMNTSGMIDQLTRIQAQYHVEKHLGTITLTRSLRKRSLMELTSKHLHWFSLNFKQQSSDNTLTSEFQSTHRANHPQLFIFIFTIFILAGSLCQAFVLGHITLYYIVLFPSAIIGLILLILIFLYSVRLDRSHSKFDIHKKNRKFYVYLNILICLTLSTLFLVAIQYHSVHNFKFLFTFMQTINQTTVMVKNFSSQINSTSNSIVINASPPPFDRRYHDYLALSTIYPLYFCCLFRPCSWLIKTFFILSCLTVQLCLFEYVWLSTNDYFPSINRLHHYTTFTLIILHGILLIISIYVREWLEKIDFVWLKQIHDERTMIARQRDDLIKQTKCLLPFRAIQHYLRTDADRALSQHYHLKYDRMALLHIRFSPSDNSNNEYETILAELLNDIHYRIRNNGEKYSNIAMNIKSSAWEVLFSIDTMNSSVIDDPIKCLQQLVELLFEIDERLQIISPSSLIRQAACLHIGCVHEILIHLEKYPKTDMWSDHVALVQLLLAKTQPGHCLTTATVYHLLNDLYLFRMAGSIVSTQTNTANNTNIYYLLGRLIGDNVFQGRNALPLTIGHGTIGTVQKSSSTDDSHRSQLRCKLNSQTGQNQIQTSTTTTTTTSSSGAINEQQSLIKQSSRKHVRISNGSHASGSSVIENPSYRRTLLQALNGTTPTPDNQNHQQPSPAKKFCARLTTKKHTPPPRDSFVPRMVHMSDNSCWSSREVMSASENSGSKCLILTQKMLNGSIDDTRCKSTPPPPAFRHASSERKSFTEEDFRQLLHHGGQSSKELMAASRSLSTTNEETTSSFSGWDDIPASPLPSVKSAIAHIQRKESVKRTPPPPPIVDCYYPRRPCDLSFTVNMSTTEDDTSSRTDTKSTVIASPTSTVVTLTSLSQKPLPVMKSPSPVPAPSQQPVVRYRPAPFNLAHKLIAETSESALSEISVDSNPEPWTQNNAYQSRHLQRSRLSSSYSNLLDLIQQRQEQTHNLAKYPFSKEMPGCSSTIHSDLLQRWLEDQLNLFRHQIKQTPPPPTTKKFHRFSTGGGFGEGDSDDDESDTVSENTFTVLTNNNSNPQAAGGAAPSLTSVKRPHNHVRYKPVRKMSIAAAHLIRHESLKHRNKPLHFSQTSKFNPHHRQSTNNNNNNSMPKGMKTTRTDTSSMPRSDLSDLSSSRPDNLSESVISNLESEYDNIYTQPITAKTTTTLMSNSQILSDDDDDEPTITSRCYF